MSRIWSSTAMEELGGAAIEWVKVSFLRVYEVMER